MELNYRLMDGYGFGATQPSILLVFPRVDAQSNSGQGKLVDFLRAFDPETATRLSDVEINGSQTGSAPDVFVRLFEALKRRCGDRRFSKITVFDEDNDRLYAVPTLATEFAEHVLHRFIEFLSSSKANFTVDDVRSFVENLRKQCTRFIPGGTNSMNFISAAAEMRVPFRQFRRDYLFFGYGAGSTFFKSSVTDRESAIGVTLAASKAVVNDFLAMSKFPVAEQTTVRTLAQAEIFAKKVGYPVVLKPESESQGRGVFANIEDSKELAHFFAELQKTHKSFLIERHVAGDHYRIDMMGDVLIKAVRRHAPFVTGDGVTAIRALVDLENQDSERLDPYSSKKTILLDEDLDRCLRKQSLDLGSVPSEGRRVYLKSISNLSRGGGQIHVEADIHQENYELFRDIASLLRLEVVGIDMLSPDLSRPWYENGAAICEVNAQPQLGASGGSIYFEFLEKYVGAPIPVEVVVSKEGDGKPRHLYNTKCAKLELNLAVQDVLKNGCPTQYFDTLTIADGVAEADKVKLLRVLQSVPPLTR